MRSIQWLLVICLCFGTALAAQDRGRRGPKPVFQTDVPEHPVDIVLTRPTSDSVTLSILAYEDARAYVAYGTSSETLELRADPVELRPDVPMKVALTGLEPDTRYHYQLRDAVTHTPLLSDPETGTFHTQRTPGSTFTFTITADSHLENNTNLQLYERTLRNALADQPDFHIDLGDTFMTEKYRPDFRGAAKQYLAQRYFFGLLGHSAPLFLVLGNHDGEAGWLDDGSAESMAGWSIAMRKNYFPGPEPDGFYTGNKRTDLRFGTFQNYYAFEWGDALFVVLDPFWSTTKRSRPGATRWNRTLGSEQYQWFAATLAKSDARYKFVFIHHLVGGADHSSRGGVEAAGLYEWGGRNEDGSDGFHVHRAGWRMPIHELMMQHHVNAVFHGHDHFFSHQELDGIAYILTPQPGHWNRRDRNLAADYGYHSGTSLPSAGHLRVEVSPENVTVEYVRAFIQASETERQRNGDVAHRCLLGPGKNHTKPVLPSEEDQPEDNTSEETPALPARRSSRHESRDARPNIIFMLADDQSWNGLSVPMHPEMSGSKNDAFHTPNLERLAQEGMRFSAAYAPSSVCSPTRASLLTGRSPTALHWTKAARSLTAADNPKMIPPRSERHVSDDEMTVAEMLRDAGYATAHFGKWHIGGGGPERHGFDVSDGDLGNEAAPRFTDPNPVDIFGMAQRAERFMAQSMEDGKPFFIQLSWHALHSPQNALKATLEKYETAGIQRGKQAQRAAITEDLDTGVGRILESLERLGLAENTYVIYTSDNGGGGGGRRGVLSGGKGSLWEGGIRVPFIVRGPGITPESWCHVPIVGYDLFPTYLEWAGVDVLPDELKLRLDGASIAHLLANEGDVAITRQRDGLVFHFPHYQSGDGPHSALLLGNFKLIKFYETGRLSLFDLAADAGERNDLSQSLPEKTAEMATLLDRHLSEIGAQMPTVNPDYDPSQPTATQHDGRSAKRSDR